MLNKKILSLLICLFCFTSFISAEEIKPGSLKEPYKKNIILVVKVSLKNPIDIEARREAFLVLEQKPRENAYAKLTNNTLYMLDIENHPESGTNLFLFSSNASSISTGNIPEFGETLFVEVTPKDGKFTIPYFRGMILPYINSWFRFPLPAGVTIAIPEDAKYVYIGTFEYELDYALRVIGFNHYDEYSAAQKELNEALGYEAPLYRAELTFN